MVRAHVRKPHAAPPAEAPAAEGLPLRTVSRLTGLSADVIRAWEKRYAVVAPGRGPRGARLYSAADVGQLRLLRRVVGGGRAIGDVARLTRRQLEALVQSARLPSERAAMEAGEGVLARALAALERFAVSELDAVLGHALAALGTRAFVEQVACPLLAEIGQRWSDGRVSVAEEHLLSSQLRSLLIGVLRTRGAGQAPTVLLATPPGERHEFGLLLVALLIADAGLNLCYLGADLPAAEVAAAARRVGAAAVGLGVVNGDNRRAAIAAVRRVERGLPARTELWLGGREAAAVASHLAASRAVVLDHLAAVEGELARLRAHAVARL